jgi:putative ABC transport system permease protein
MRWYQRFFRRELAEKHLDVELRFHLEQRIADLVTGGMAPEEARRQARLEFGGLDQVKEECRDVGGSHMIETLVQDLRYGLRMLTKAPGFTAVAVLSLALGIGGTATVFSWAEVVLLHPLQLVHHAGQMMAVETVMPDGEYHTSSYPDYRDYRDESHSFSGMIGFEFVDVDTQLPTEKRPQRTWGEIVTENYFDVLGVKAGLGRILHADDNRGLRSDPYIVLSYGFWQSRFASDPAVVGKTIEMNRRPFTVIGVAPRGFNGTIVGVAANYWVPMMMQPVILPGESLTQRAPSFIHMMGRLRPGAGIGRAQAELGTMAKHLAEFYPATNRNIGVHVCPVWKANYGLQAYLLPVIGFLAVAVILVLLIVCANVANLLLARSTVREKEIAIRSALGASRARLVRQMLVEGLLLSLLGGAIGIALASSASKFLMLFLPPLHLPIGLPLGVDSRVLWLSVVLSVTTVLFFGLGPAWLSSRPDLNGSLKEGGRTSSAGEGRHRLRGLLVIAETVLGVMLLSGAGLLIRSLRDAGRAGPGFNTRHVLLAALDLKGNGYSAEQSGEFLQQLLGQIRTLPRVKGVTLEQWVPLWFTGRGYTRLAVEGYTPKPGEDMGIDYNEVGPNYFSLMGIPILSGRGFTDRDGPRDPLVCVVNETMARRFWTGESPVGHLLDIWGQKLTIVGVAKDIKYHSMNEGPEAFLYLPFFQHPRTDANVLVKTSGDPWALLGPVKAQVRALDPGVPLVDTDTISDLFHVSLFPYRTAAAVATVLGVLGLLLAAVGLYGVISYSVTQRTHEIGIRVALGASQIDVLRLVVGQGFRLTMMGVGVGVAGALALTRYLSSLLYGVRPTDPLTFVAVSIILIGVALFASYIPARRAAKVDPMVALRYE